MRLSVLEKTCSMYELGEVTEQDILYNNFMYRLENLISDEFGIDEETKDDDEEYNDCNSAQAIIYNTTFNAPIRNRLKKYGFKEVMSYIGNGKSRVYIMILDWKNYRKEKKAAERAKKRKPIPKKKMR